MIDVQIVAGRRPEVLAESVARVLDQSEAISEVFVAISGQPSSVGGGEDGEPANCQPSTANAFSVDDVTVFEHPPGLTFEQNHNLLAKWGSSPFLLFLDDDAFLFEEAIDTLFEKIQSERDVAVVGGVNNQTFPVEAAPAIGSLADFKGREAQCASVASQLMKAQADVWAPRIFLPGNCLLVRRKVWQKEYGGWDEGYRNWNEEVDFTAWCFERGYRALCTPSVWFYHCQGQSRSLEGLHADVLASARHFAEKWPLERAEKLGNALQRQGLHRLAMELRMLLEASARDSDPERLRASPYFQSMQAVLE